MKRKAERKWKMSKTAGRIAAACEGIVKRSDEIVALSERQGAALSRIFSRKEIRVTNEICCELALAVADSASVDDLVANRENFERMRAHVAEANETLAERMTANPQTMSAIMNAEDTLIDLLVAADPTVRLLAGFAKKFLPILKSALTAFFTDIRVQLELGERKGPGGIWRIFGGSLAELVGKRVVSEFAEVFARYGTPRDDRKSIIGFLRSLYDKNDPRLSSGAKVIAYVRGCTDAEDPNFERCAEVRMRVAALARNNPDKVEGVWNSLAVQMKPSYGRSRRKSAGLGSVPIPERSWA